MSTATHARRDYSHVTPANLDSLSADDFREVVNIDLKRHASSPGRWISPDVSEALRSPKFRQRWLSTLTSILLRADAQLSTRWADHFRKEAELGKQVVQLSGSKDPDALRQATTLSHRIADARVDFWSHRAKTLRFRLAVADAIEEARQCCGLTDQETALRHDRDVQAERVQLLEAQIRLHRQLVLADLDGDEPDEIDLNLWSLIPNT